MYLLTCVGQTIVTHIVATIAALLFIIVGLMDASIEKINFECNLIYFYGNDIILTYDGKVFFAKVIEWLACDLVQAKLNNISK